MNACCVLFLFYKIKREDVVVTSASQRLWESLVSIEHYIAYDLVPQFQSSHTFSGSDMKPIFMAYKVFKETRPHLSKELVEQVDALFEATQASMNNFLDYLRWALATGDKNSPEAIKKVDAEYQKALSMYRNSLSVIEKNIAGSGYSVAANDINVVNFFNSGDSNSITIGPGSSCVKVEASTPKFPLDISLSQLTEELHALRFALREQAISPAHDQVVADIGKAEEAAKAGKYSEVMKHLKSAGKFAFDTAIDIGKQVAAEAIKSTL